MTLPSRTPILALLIAALTCGPIYAGQTTPASAADPQVIWDVLARPAFDGKPGKVENLVIERDKIRITLESGTLEFTQPVNGLVTGAVFHGTGRLQVSVPDARESQQLELFVKADGINLAFSEAVFSFSDKTHEEVAPQLKASEASAGAAEFYASRVDQNEDLGAVFLPRLFQSVMGKDRSKSALFLADVKTADLGWVEALYAAADPEEISVGRWQEIYGGVKNFDIWTELSRGRAKREQRIRTAV